MKVVQTVYRGRKAWELDNEALTLTMLQGGGHIAGIVLRNGPKVNPLWAPVWKTIEPWHYGKNSASRYASRLLASICGHNICLGWFGDPSKDEAKAGMGCHGEAPVTRWKLERKNITRNAVSLTCGCVLPVAGMKLVRTLRARLGGHIVHIREELRNLTRRDIPYTMCEHVTVGPPFLEKGVTVFDMPATCCQTFPGKFGDPQRLKPDTPFMWPAGPGARGEKVNMRMIDRKYKASSDFSVQKMNPAKQDAWFSAVNPKLGLLLACVWRRADFPWLGNWEENYGRKDRPWAGKSLTRGMEFANSPFPVSLRDAAAMGRFQGEPTVRWLPARGKARVEYRMVLVAVPHKTGGVADIRAEKTGLEIDLIAG